MRDTINHKKIQIGDAFPQSLIRGLKLKAGQRSPQTVTYHNIPQDPGGWVDASRFLPKCFDLLHLKIQEETKSGWYTGCAWDGKRVLQSDQVLYWKKSREL